MALQNDNTILNKGDLKAYHQKILPFLGGNIATTITNGNIYSQEERVVGIWVDGRPLYQKTYILNLSRSYSANTTYQEVFDSDTNKAAVKVWGTYEDNDGRINVIESFYNYNNQASSYVPYLSWCYNYLASGAYTGHGIMYKGGASAYTCKQMVITMQYWKKTDTADIAAITPGVYDINRPDLWPANKEIFFGNGLYGQRFTRSATTATNTQYVLQAGVSKIINCGGTQWRTGDGYAHPMAVFPNGTAYPYFYIAANTMSGGTGNLSIWGATVTMLGWDCWAIYTK